MQLMSAIGYMHYNNLWHGNIHSGNIFLDKASVCKLFVDKMHLTSDYTDRYSYMKFTKQSFGQPMHKLDDKKKYLSPELVFGLIDAIEVGECPVDMQKADVWSMGINLLEMATGEFLTLGVWEFGGLRLTRAGNRQYKL